MAHSFRCVALGVALCAVEMPLLAAEGEAVQAPAFKAGDAWLFNDVIEKGQTGYGETRLKLVIDEVFGATMNVGIKHDGAPSAFEDHIVGSDWSQRRLVDGQQTVTTRPFAFPMHVGQSWTVDYMDSTRRGNQLSAHVRRTYFVRGWEDTDVPAGHFHALKVEEQGVDEVTVEVPSSAAAGVTASSGGSTSISHAQKGGVEKHMLVTHAELFYVPDVKNYVKSVEDQYNADNVRIFRQTRTLISFTPAN